MKEDWKEYYNQEVESNHKEVTPKEVEKDIDKLIEAVHLYSSDEDRINQLFRLLPLKKNKKLSKSSKPVLHVLKYGAYLEDHYGWKTKNLRMVAIDELNAKVYLDSTIVHY